MTDRPKQNRPKQSRSDQGRLSQSPPGQARPDQAGLGLDIAALAATVDAPESLHRRVQEMVEEASRPERGRAAARSRRSQPPWRMRLSGAIAVAAAAAAALVLVLSGGSSSPLTVQRAVALTLGHPTMPAPSESPTHRSQLDVAVEGVAFPYWRERFGWRSAGARADRIGGRAVTTVFYTDASGRQIGYAIVSGRAPATHGGKVVWSRGVPYRVSSQAGATVVTWPRSGRLCVIAGKGVAGATLLRLAGWSGERTTAA